MSTQSTTQAIENQERVEVASLPVGAEMTAPRGRRRRLKARMLARAPGELTSGRPSLAGEGDGAWHGEAEEVVGIAMANSRMRQAFALRIFTRV